MFRLLRLILIGSYCRNRIVEIDLAGHITLNGENGAGKTTLLRLLPIFFGETPSRIVRGDAVTEKFSRYYFPDLSSYVIFEYARRDETSMVVLHTDAQGDALVYRFIPSEFKLEIFKDAQGVVPSTTLYRHLVKSGFSDCRALGREAYKQVIQNTPSRDLRPLAARFAFCSTQGRLTHIERIVTGILKRATKFHDLKRMIASTILDSDDAFALTTTRKDLVRWVSEYDAHVAVMQKREVMNELEVLDERRKGLDGAFEDLHARIVILRDRYERLQRLDEESEATHRQHRASEESRFASLIREATDRINGIESDIRSTEAELANLNAARKRYDKEDAEEKELQLSRLSVIESDLEARKKSLQELEAGQKTVIELFHSMEDKARDAHREALAQCQLQRQEAVDAVRDEADTLKALHHERRLEVERQQRSEIDGLNQQIADARVLENEARMRVDSIQADDSFIEAMDRAQEQERLSGESLRDALESRNRLNRDKHEALEKLQEAERRIDHIKRTITQISDEIDVLVRSNTGSTLLRFLRENKSDWVQTIGKTVPDSLLLREDLSPALSSGNDLYGVHIDLEKLDASQFSSEEEVIRRIEEKRALLAAKVDARDVASEIHNELLMNSQRVQDEINLSEAAIAVAKQNKEEAVKAINSAKKTLLSNIEEKKSKALVRLRDVQRAINALHSTLSDLTSSHQRDIKNLISSHTERLQEIEAKRSAILARYADMEREIARTLDQRLTDLAKERDQQLLNKGFSVDFLNKIRAEVDALQTDVIRIRHYAVLVVEYKAWRESKWSRKGEHEAHLLKRRSEAESARKERDRLIEERQREIERIDQIILAIQNNIATHAKWKAAASSQIHLLAAWHPKSGVTDEDVTESVSDLIERRVKNGRILNECMDAIKSGIEDIKLSMARNPETGPGRYYYSVSPNVSPTAIHEWVQEFRIWFADRHVENQNSINQLGKTMALNISHFWKTLEHFKRQVANFSAELRANLAQGQVFDSVANVEVSIQTHIDTQSYWAAIQTLHAEYEAWYGMLDAALPPQSFVDALKEVSRVVGEDNLLVADPVDLIHLRVSASVNNEAQRTATNENELAHMSSNGLSYIILCVILIGFVNRIRKKEEVFIPFVVDELKDLSYSNARTLLDLLTKNRITMISAFPDVDLDLAELFQRNYKILPERKVGIVKLEDEYA